LRLQQLNFVKNEDRKLRKTLYPQNIGKKHQIATTYSQFSLPLTTSRAFSHIYEQTN